MTVFADLYAEIGIPALMEMQGSSVSYTAAGSAAKTVTAIFDDMGSERNEHTAGITFSHGARLTIQTDATAGIASPLPDDKVVVSGTTWTVLSVLDKGQGFAVLALERSSINERTGGKYRSKI